jgi:hypothetical protein
MEHSLLSRTRSNFLEETCGLLVDNLGEPSFSQNKGL